MAAAAATADVFVECIEPVPEEEVLEWAVEPTQATLRWARLLRSYWRIRASQKLWHNLGLWLQSKSPEARRRVQAIYP